MARRTKMTSPDDVSNHPANALFESILGPPLTKMTRKAVHKHAPDVTVRFTTSKDVLGELIQFAYDNGERSSMNVKAFFELFAEVQS